MFQIPSSRAKKSTLNIGLIGCPKMSEQHYHSSLDKIPEDCRSYFSESGIKLLHRKKEGHRVLKALTSFTMHCRV
jgi:hypothetical protein